MPTVAIVLVAVLLFGFLLLSSMIKIVQEYERGVIFRLGRLVGALGPGLFFLIPGVERMRKVDLRIVTLEVPAQEAITRDNVTVKVNAVVYFRVVDPEEAVVKVLDYIRATSLIGQTTLRSILGQSDLDHLLSERDKINAELQQVIDTQTSAWGIKVTSVEVRDLELPQSMQRAMARKLRPSARSGPRLSMPRVSSVPVNSLPTPLRSSAVSPRPYNCATCRR
jgi:regulator of protease activity HflC (stomatin/prohibitin superfamily)